MKLDFYKYQGAGNDFILIDNRKSSFPKNDIELISKLCKRHFGIGSDGLILIEKSISSDFYMEFFNPDGSQSFCGNGSRCAVLFAYHLGIVKKTCVFESKNGTNSAEIVAQDEVKLKMFDVPFSTIKKNVSDWILETGSPHYTIFKDEINSINIIQEARKIRYNEEYTTKGINVNYIALNPIEADSIYVRTYERGVEDETLACGTGVTACALAYNLHVNQSVKSVKVNALGGQLLVSFEKDNHSFHSIFLQGQAKYVFKGEVDV